jgi:hypothetical protein
MILIPNYSTPKRLESENARRYSDKFHVYHSPAEWTDNGSDKPSANYNLRELKSGVYNEWCRWDGGNVRLKGSFGGSRKIDTVILGNPSFDYIKGFLYRTGNAVLRLEHTDWITNDNLYMQTDEGFSIVFDNWTDGVPVSRTLAPGRAALQHTDQKIIIFSFLPVECDSFDLEFIGSGPVTLNKIYFGNDTRLPLASTLEFPVSGRGRGAMTDTGVAYGTKYPPYRGFKAAWDMIDDEERQTMEEYITTVQNVEPHFICPVHEDYYIPPMFAQLQTQDMENKRWPSQWFWDGSPLEWTEAR